MCMLLCLSICEYERQPIQRDDLSKSTAIFTCQVSSVVKSRLSRLFHLLVIHNNFLDGEIIALEFAAIPMKTTGNKHEIMIKRASN